MKAKAKHAKDKDERFCIFGGLNNDAHDHILFKEFSFSVQILKRTPHSPSRQLSEQCMEFGAKIYTLATTNLPHGELKRLVSFRPCFHQHNVVTRLSFFLLDLTAFLSTQARTELHDAFQEVVKPRATSSRRKTRLITTGMVRAILCGLAVKVHRLHSKGKYMAQILNHTRLTTQKRWLLDYAQLATSLIETFYYQNVRLSYDPDTRYGLVSNRLTPIPASPDAEFVCASMDLTTNAACTRTATPNSETSSLHSEDEDITTGFGIFGVTYYMNSNLPLGDQHIQNCRVVTSDNVCMSIFEEGNNAHIEYSDSGLHISIAQVIPYTRDIYYNDDLLWSYKFTQYAPQTNKYTAPSPF